MNFDHGRALRAAVAFAELSPHQPGASLHLPSGRSVKLFRDAASEAGMEEAARGINRLTCPVLECQTTPRPHPPMAGPAWETLSWRRWRWRGRDIENLTPDDFAPFENLHVRGRSATRDLARLAGLRPGARVLHVGCGIGGPARTLAVEYGCRVTGIDITESYVEAGRHAH